MSNFNLKFTPNTSSWGPIQGDEIKELGQITYAHYDKKERKFPAGDFSPAMSMGQKQGTRRRGDDNTTEFTFKFDAAEESSFQLVDSSKTAARKAKCKFSIFFFYFFSIFSFLFLFFYSFFLILLLISFLFSIAKRQISKSSKGGAARSNRARAPGFKKRNKRQDRKEHEPSLVVKGDWELVEEFELSNLSKYNLPQPAGEDLYVAGFINQYNESYDRVSSKYLKKLNKNTNKVYYDIPVIEDSKLADFAVEGEGEIFATDSIIAHLMCSPKSVFPWDITVEKADGIIFLDKRENSDFDLLTVCENAADPPTNNEDVDEINHPISLSQEATFINQYFSQQVLLPEQVKTFEPNHFIDSNDNLDEIPSTIYRYRRFNLGKDLRLVVRSEVTGYLGDQYINSYAFNEFDPKYSNNWRQKIDSQIGAVLANELKNNSNKVAKWTAQSILADVSLMKIGYVSRTNFSSNTDHDILAVQTLKPKDLARQINLNVENIWGIIKIICEVLMKKPDGNYVIMKDPNKAIVRIYSVPQSEDIEGEENEDEEENDEDEDAN